MSKFTLIGDSHLTRLIHKFLLSRKACYNVVSLVKELQKGYTHFDFSY